MLKTILLTWVLLQPSSEPKFVNQFHQLTNKEEEESFINQYTNTSVDANAYVIALEMKKAQYTIFPWRKWSIFQTQKKELNQLVSQHPQNVHLRYIRLVLQEQTPAFLGYNTYIAEDKDFLLTLLNKNDSTDYMDTYIKQHTSL